MKKEEFIEKMQEKSNVLGVRFFVEQTEQFFPTAIRSYRRS